MAERKSVLRRIIKAILIALSAVTLVLVLLLLFLILPPGQKIIKGIAQSQLSKALKQDVYIGQLKTNLFSKVSLRDIRLLNPDSDTAKPILKLNRLDVYYNLKANFKRELVIRAAVIDSLKLALRHDSTSGYNIAMLNAPAEPSEDAARPGMKIILEAFDLHNLSVDFQNVPEAIDMSIRDLAVKARLDSIGSFSFQVSIEKVEALYDSLPLGIESFSTGGFIDDEYIHIDSLSCVSENLRLTAAANIPFDSMSELRVDLLLAGDPHDVFAKVAAYLGMEPFRSDGELSLKVQAGGSFEKPRLKAHLNLPELRVSNITVKNPKLIARWQTDSLLIDSFSLRVFNGVLSGDGIYVLDTCLKSKAHIMIEKLDLESVWNSLYAEKSPYLGKIGGEVSISGHGHDIGGWELLSDLRTKKAVFRDKPLPDFQAKLALNDGKAKLEIIQEEININARAAFENDLLDGDFEIKIGRLGPLAGLANLRDLEGSIDAQGRFYGRMEAPTMEAAIEGRRITYQNFPLDSLMARIEYRDNIMTIDEMRFFGALEYIDSAKPLFFMDSVSGGFNYQGHLYGRPDSLGGGVEVFLSEPRYGAYGIDSGYINLGLDGNGSVDIAAEIIRQPYLLTSAGRFNIRGKAGNLDTRVFYKSPVIDLSNADPQNTMAGTLIGSLSSDFDLSNPNAVSINAAGNDIALSAFESLIGDSMNLDGSLNFKFDFSGSQSNPRARMNASVLNPKYGDVEIDSIIAELSLSGNEFRINTLQTFGLGTQLEAEGTVQLYRDSLGGLNVNERSRIQGSANLDDFDLMALQPFLSPGIVLTGKSSVDLEWAGSLKSPEITGWIEVDESRLRLNEQTQPIENINLRAVLQDTILTLEKVNAEIMATPIMLRGVIILSELSRIRSDLNFAIANTGSGTISGLASRDSLALRAKIDRLNLELFQPFLTEINNLSGMLSCEFNISGAPDNPEIIGNLDVRNLAFRHQMFMTPFEDGAVKLSFDRRNVRLDTIFLRLGEGSISMMGQMSQTQGEIDDLNIIAGLTDIRFSQPKQYAVHLKSAALRYSKQNEYYLVDGDIQFGESRLMTNLNLKSLLPWAQAVERRQPDLPPLLQKTRLDVRIRESSDLWVDNNLAHLRLHSELGIIGSPAQPNFTGMLKVEEGYLLYLDRKFNVTRGELYFIDPNRFNPEINLQARAKVTSYQGISSVQYVIILSVEGILDELTTQIYSEPPLDKPDIVALLTLGATRNQLMGKSTGNGEGGAKDIILERAGMLTSQKASGYFTNKLGTFMGLDQVSVEGNLFRFDKSWGPQLLASKRISRQLEMTYTTNVGHMNEQSIRLDYMFSKYFSLQGQTDQRGRSALDLKYRLKFK